MVLTSPCLLIRRVGWKASRCNGLMRQFIINLMVNKTFLKSGNTWAKAVLIFGRRVLEVAMPNEVGISIEF